MAQQLGSPQRLRTRMDAGDVDMLLGAAADSSPAQLADAAFQRGLHLTSAGAERFAAAAEVDEAARLALEEAGYRELQQQLRTRVAPPAVAAGTMPPLPTATVAGATAALLGPLPGAAAPMELEPAQLEVTEEEEGVTDGDGGIADGGEGSGRACGGGSGRARGGGRGRGGRGCGRGGAGGRGDAGSGTKPRGRNQKGELSAEEHAAAKRLRRSAAARAKRAADAAAAAAAAADDLAAAAEGLATLPGGS